MLKGLDALLNAETVRMAPSVYPLDSVADDAAARMEVVGDPATPPSVQADVQAEIDGPKGRAWPLAGVERFAFCARAACAVIRTSEPRFHGRFALRKGVIERKG